MKKTINNALQSNKRIKLFDFIDLGQNDILRESLLLPDYKGLSTL